MAPSAPGSPTAGVDLAESELVAGLIAGRPAAVGAFLDRTHRAVFCLAGRFTRDAGQRSDWSHEVLLGVLDDLRQQRFTYTRPGSFWAWFRKRAYFRLIDQYRLQRRQRERQAGAPGSGPVDPDHLPGPYDPSEDLERMEVRRALDGCLEKLPSISQRRALEMLLFEELDYQSIAETLDAPLNTVRAWIRRARIAVRRCLARALNLQLDAHDA